MPDDRCAATDPDTRATCHREPGHDGQHEGTIPVYDHAARMPVAREHRWG